MLNSKYQTLISLQTALNTTGTQTPPQPPLPQASKPGGADGLQRELDRLSANEDLIRTSVTVLQNTMHSLTTAANKLNLDMVTQKHKFNSLMLYVSSQRNVTLITVV